MSGVVVVVLDGGGGSSGRQRCGRRLPDRIDDVVAGLPDRIAGADDGLL